MAVLAFHICEFSYTKIRQQDPMEQHLKVAMRLSALDIAPGSAVASIGDGNQAFWARLGRVKIVAEIPFDVWDPVVRTPDISDVEVFWAAGPEVRAAVMRKLAETGAKAVIARDVRPGPAAFGWQEIAGTPYSIYIL